MSGRARLLRCYPRAWRDRYGDELLAYLDDMYGEGRLPVRAMASLASGGVRERLVGFGLSPAAAPAARAKAGALTVLAAWSMFVVAGLVFAKSTEHYEAALSGPQRPVAVAAFTALQVLAVLSAVVVAAGLVVAAPALVRFLADGGWRVIRGHASRAVVCAAAAAGLTVVLVVWAHRLTPAQRNGAYAAYGAAFVTWAGLVVLTIGLATVAALAAGRRLDLTPRVLRVERLLGLAATAGMVLMLVAAVVWASADAAALSRAVLAAMALMLVAMLTAGAGAAVSYAGATSPRTRR